MQDAFDRSSHIASLEPLTCSEINDPEREVIMFDQIEPCLRRREKSHRKRKYCEEVKRACKIGPDLGDGLLRVGGHLSRAPLHDSKHQIIIAKNSPLARLLIQHFHQ